ncbi:hypothetical protein [Pseudogemmobacter sp. W21_MBD1_M6]|uniref:hypothetical protein n=1 Tax=Pseudogemmobacter sp. W21_MBD1_M6 TaxID=3240271 RepID=UPI003F97DE78
MPVRAERRRLHLRRDTIKILLAASVFGAVYFLFLSLQNDRAQSYFEDLRRTNPDLYLDNLRKSDGFAEYVDTFRLLEGYYTDKIAAPPFLVGRWTMKPAPQRIASGTVFADCKDPIVFEQGLVEFARDGIKTQHQVTYRIIGQKVFLNGEDINHLAVTMVSYGAAIDHLELVPPGRDQTHYAYPCGT